MAHPERYDQPNRQPNRKVKLCELWERTSGRGTSYLSGFLGDLALVAFREERDHPRRPGERIAIWKVFVEERDPVRRPGGGQ